MRLGHHEIVRELGRGATSIVYEARTPGGEAVAIKLFPDSTRAPARLDRERRLQLALGMAGGFVPLIGHGEAKEGVYLIMPLVRGGTLRARLGTKLSPEATVAIGRALAAAMARAHAAGVVHRDLKPENILMAEDGRPLIADLGLAKHYREDAPGASASVELTKPGSFLGTRGYAPVEQMRDGRAATTRSDVFALGAILYECLTGRFAFEGETVGELYLALERGDVVPVRRLRADAPAWLAEVIERALARDPAARFADAAELLDALQEEDVSAVSSRPRRPLRRRSVAVAALALVIAAAIVAGSLALVASRSQVVDNTEARLADFERRGLLGDPLEVLARDQSGLLEHAPTEARASIEVAWAKLLHRRARFVRARPVALANSDAPGKDGLEAKRILADILSSERSEKAKPLLDSLDKGGAPWADWALLRRSVSDPKVLVSREVRARVAAGSDPASLRLLAEVLRREDDAARALQTLQRIVGNIATDDAVAHLGIAVLLTKGRSLEELRSAQEARPHVDAWRRAAGEEAETSPEGLYQRAITELASKDLASMIADLGRAIALGLDTVDAHALRAWLPDAAGRKSLARAGELDPARAIGLAPTTDDILVLANVVGSEASKRIDSTVARASEPARDALARAVRASAAGEPTARTGALFVEASKLAPSCPVVALERARFLVSRCRLTEAREALVAAKRRGASETERALLEIQLDARVLSLEPAHVLVDALPAGEPLCALATAILQVAETDDEPRAVVLARHAVELLPDDPTAHCVLAQAIAASTQDASELQEAVLEARTALALGARLDEENELALLTALWRAALAPRAMGRTRPSANLRLAFSNERYDALMASQPSPRLAYWLGYNALVNSFGVRTERVALEVAASSRADFVRARDLDEQCVLGTAGLGLLEAILNAVAAQTGATPSDARVRSNWVEVRTVDASWRMPRGWKHLVSREIWDEFGAAPR